VASSSPRILSSDVSRDGWNGIVVSVSEKPPAAIVCGNLPDFSANDALSDDGDCYAADASGYLFEKMPATGGAQQYVRYYIPSLPDSQVIGTQATSSAEFTALQSFVAGARSAGIKPEAVLMKDGGEYEMYSDDPFIVVYFNDKAGLSAELSDLTAFWSHMSSRSAAAGADQGFEYIDLRYGSNVFYR